MWSLTVCLPLIMEQNVLYIHGIHCYFLFCMYILISFNNKDLYVICVEKHGCTPKHIVTDMKQSRSLPSGPSCQKTEATHGPQLSAVITLCRMLRRGNIRTANEISCREQQHEATIFSTFRDSFNKLRLSFLSSPLCPILAPCYAFFARSAWGKRIMGCRVRPSVHMIQLENHRTKMDEIRYMDVVPLGTTPKSYF